MGCLRAGKCLCRPISESFCILLKVVPYNAMDFLVDERCGR